MDSLFPRYSTLGKALEEAVSGLRAEARDRDQIHVSVNVKVINISHGLLLKL